MYSLETKIICREYNLLLKKLLKHTYIIQFISNLYVIPILYVPTQVHTYMYLCIVLQTYV